MGVGGVELCWVGVALYIDVYIICCCDLYVRVYGGARYLENTVMAMLLYRMFY